MSATNDKKNDPQFISLEAIRIILYRIFGDFPEKLSYVNDNIDMVLIDKEMGVFDVEVNGVSLRSKMKITSLKIYEHLNLLCISGISNKTNRHSTTTEIFFTLSGIYSLSFSKSDPKPIKAVENESQTTIKE